MAEKAGTQQVVVLDRFGTAEPLSYEDIRGNTDLIKKLVKGALEEDVDYGLIPGCGDKPSLLKPGAEKLLLLFKLGSFPEAQDLSEPDVVRFVVRTKIIHIPSGREICVGIGSASSDEEKYKWRKVVCDEEFETTPDERKRLKWKKGNYDRAAHSYGKPEQIKQVRTNPADLNNTIIKMASKRSLVDAAIRATAASDILAQDLEEEENQAGAGDGSQIAAPQAKTPEGGEIPTPRGYKMMDSKFDGKCKGCDQPIAKGAPIAFNPKKGTFHPDCAV